MTDDGLRPLTDTSTAWSARKVVRALGLRDHDRRRPRVVVAMIASADGRVAVQGRSVGLGHPADRALLRELRTAADALLVGTGTLRAERYANLLDDDQRKHRAAAGLEPEPIVATISRRLDLPGDIPLLAEPTARVQVYTEAEGEVPSQGAWVAVQRFDPGQLTMPAILEHLSTERGARTILCEGGPTLLRELVAADCVDDLLLTVAPMLVAGDAPTPLSGDRDRPARGPGAARHPSRRRPPLPALHPVSTLRLRDRTVAVQAGRPLIMGIVNAGDDSFSDAVRLDTLEGQVARALELVAEGADLIDVGAESGVTYTATSSAEEEAARVVPLVERLAAEGVSVSVDTWKPAVARAALDAGAAMLNDVSGLRDPGLAELAARTGAALVVMHTRAEPKQEAFPHYDDVVADVEAFLRERIDARARPRRRGRADRRRSRPRLRQDAGADGRRPARPRSAARARAPAAARDLAQVLPGRDHGPGAGRAPGGHACRRGVGGRRRGRDPARARRRGGARRAVGQGRPRGPRGGPAVRRRRRGAEVDPRRPLA